MVRALAGHFCMFYYVTGLLHSYVKHMQGLADTCDVKYIILKINIFSQASQWSRILKSDWLIARAQAVWIFPSRCQVGRILKFSTLATFQGFCYTTATFNTESNKQILITNSANNIAFCTRFGVNNLN